MGSARSAMRLADHGRPPATGTRVPLRAAFIFRLGRACRSSPRRPAAKWREGETGLIRVLDLANVFSVAAIQTEDLALRRGDGL